MTSRRVKKRKRWKRKLKRKTYDQHLNKFIIKTDLIQLLLPEPVGDSNNTGDCMKCLFRFSSPVGEIGERTLYRCVIYNKAVTERQLLVNYQTFCRQYIPKRISSCTSKN